MREVWLQYLINCLWTTVLNWEFSLRDKILTVLSFFIHVETWESSNFCDCIHMMWCNVIVFSQWVTTSLRLIGKRSTSNSTPHQLNFLFCRPMVFLQKSFLIFGPNIVALWTTTSLQMT
jgi:hypothetical protein